MGADTIKPGAPLPGAFVLHNCTEREVYFDYNGDFDAWMTMDFSLDESGPFEIELWSVTTGKKCPKRAGTPARGRLTGFAPVLPGNLCQIELPLHEWAVLDEPGAYRAVIARNILLTRDRNWDRNSDPALAQRFRATHEVFFVVSAGE